MFDISNVEPLIPVDILGPIIFAAHLASYTGIRGCLVRGKIILAQLLCRSCNGCP